ncbi:hypothetical protein V2J09_009856 [Rumex salicifolius]
MVYPSTLWLLFCFDRATADCVAVTVRPAGNTMGSFSVMAGLPFSSSGPGILHKQQVKHTGLQFGRANHPLLIICWRKGPKKEASTKKHEANPQNVDLPPALPKKKKKPFPVPIQIIQRNARADRKLAELGVEKPLEPPKNGLLVPELIPLAHEVVDAWKDLIKGVAQLLHVIPVYACSECPEVHVAYAGHRIQDCEGPTSRKRKGYHSWIKGSITDVLIPIDSYHLYDPFGRRVKHDTRFDFDRIPAVIELCIQAGVDLPDFSSRRRTRPIRVMGKKIIDRGGYFKDPPRPDTSSSSLTELDTQGASSRFPPPDASDIPQIAQETMEAYETVAMGVRRLMGKYSVKACGYCPEVHVGPWGHDAKLCGAFKHQWRDGKHGWQDAIVDEVFPPNYVWHVRDPKGPPLVGSLRTFYGKAPAIVELCMQAGAQVPRKYLPMMRLDIVLPETEEASFGMSSKKKESVSAAMKRTGEWIFSQEITSDITCHIGSASFPLHKFPLLSKCGYIRKLVSESTDENPLDIELSDIPGGAEAFELATNFCYGVNFEISIDNIAMLCCVAEYLEMTEDCAVGNLIERTESYLSEVVLQNLSGTVSVLYASEKLLPMAENVKLVSRCIDAIAYLACNDTQSGLLGKSEAEQNPIVDWWAEDLTLLKIDFFQRVLIAMMARGFKQYALGPILMLYAQKSLRGLEVYGKVKKKMEPAEEHKKRVILETIVSLLPKEKNSLSVSFLATLLRSSIYLETTVACRLDLEKRMALQLGQAVLDDLLIPSYAFTGDTLFDVDTVKRIMMNYLEYVLEANHLGFGSGEEYIPPSSSDLERVGKLMENYLSEIASDRNLTVPKFVAIAELIPEQTRAAEDGMYRAIDIFLKAHPDASDMERKKICSLMDCQKLSREACAHAAQNDRLPVQTVVQVLYHEQQRLHNTMNSNSNGSDYSSSTNSQKVLSLYSTTSDHGRSVSNEIETLRRENDDLKIEVLKLKMKLKEMERLASTPVSAIGSPNPSNNSTYSYANKPPLPPLPRKSFINSVSKKLGKLYPLIKGDAIAPPSAKGRTKPSKDRRHSKKKAKSTSSLMVGKAMRQ